MFGPVRESFKDRRAAAPTAPARADAPISKRISRFIRMPLSKATTPEADNLVRARLDGYDASPY
jgi:hypothetical protein